MWWDHSAGRGVIMFGVTCILNWILILSLYNHKSSLWLSFPSWVYTYCCDEEWRGCLHFTGLWNFFLFCLSGILVSYFWAGMKHIFGGGKLVVTTCDVQVQLMLRLITGSTSLWRSMPECRAVWNQWSSS